MKILLIKLDEVLKKLESGSRPKGGVSSETGDIPSIGAEHLNSEGGFNFSNIKKIPMNFFSKMKQGKLEHHDILIVKDGATTGKVSLVKEDFPFPLAAVNEHIFVLSVDNEKAFYSYVFHFLNSENGKKYILSDFRGATVGGISRKFTSKILIPLPPLSEQKRIAEILDKADELRTKRKLAIAELDTLTQSIFLEMFGDPVKNEKGWKNIDKISNVCEKIIDCPHSTPKYSNEKTQYFCIRSSDIQEGYIVFNDTKYLDDNEYNQRIKRGKPQKGDIIYCREGARFGNAGRVIETREVCLGQRMMLFRADVKKVISEYLWLVLIHPSMYKHITQMVGGSAAPHINIGDLTKITIPVPPLALQEKFADRVASVEKLKTQHKNSLSELDALFATLQDRAFKGEL